MPSNTLAGIQVLAGMQEELVRTLVQPCKWKVQGHNLAKEREQLGILVMMGGLLSLILLGVLSELNLSYHLPY